MHSRPIIANYRLGHKRGGHAVVVGHIMHYILVYLDFISLLYQGIEFCTYFTLAGMASITEHIMPRMSDWLSTGETGK